ncbi:glycosyltransferase family 2 protein [Planctomyces sp. SH-PL14]|uniref:glycosyltransferase family 2 protein n=1 Tax=Planctomyces sp. SH-PL14 TaxID=1632864 RepID=UPI00078EF778|nr:glycosyltransferase family 2 protein [Planctomyces sp. SH-PL14]AMV20772.1 Nucleotidyl transferase [Planctomyces sp. SH-PL14]
MKILVPMAGRGVSGDKFLFGKSLAEIAQSTLIELVTENLKGIEGAEFVFVISEDDARQHHLREVLQLLCPKCEILVTNRETGGAACTALLAIDHYSPDEPLIIANGDQIIDTPLQKVVEDFQRRELDGGIIVFDAVHPRWSYVRVDESGYVVEAAEKRPISRLATAGFYYFRRGRDFIDSAFAMIRRDESVNGRFYVCPVFNQMVLQERRIGIFSIPRSAYHSLATPRGIAAYNMLLSGRKESTAR